jgi:Domain of unknown function (DUF397)
MTLDNDGRWRRVCDSGSCVEVAQEGDRVFVRRSDHADGPWLAFSGHNWREFLEGVRAGEFDLRTGMVIRGR